MKHDCGSRSGSRLAKSLREVQVKQAELRSIESQRKKLEVDLIDLEHRQNELDSLRLAANDAEILRTEMSQPKRDDHFVVQDLKDLAKSNNSAPLAFWEACCDRGWFSQEQLGDFVGLAAILARVEDESLNRILAEYMGLGSLCLMVTRTQLGINALKVYNASGQVDEARGLHSFARSLGYHTPGKYEVLALSDITPMMRPNRWPAVNMEHHQRLLYIDPPTLPHSNKVAEGFLGYAVNLIYLKPEHVQMRVDTRTERNVGLRESLWFHVLRFLQVYDTRENRIFAKERLERFEGGAVSLHGGLIKANNHQQLGRRRNNVPICFGLVPFEERLSSGGLMPLPRLAMERQRESLVIARLISCRRDVLSTLVPNSDAVIEQLSELKRSLKQGRKARRESQKSSKQIVAQMADVQSAAQLRAVTEEDITETDSSGSQST